MTDNCFKRLESLDSTSVHPPEDFCLGKSCAFNVAVVVFPAKFVLVFTSKLALRFGVAIVLAVIQGAFRFADFAELVLT